MPPPLSTLVETICNRERHFKNNFESHNAVAFPCRSGLPGELVTSLRYQEEGMDAICHAILSAVERESLLTPSDSQDALICHCPFSDTVLSIILQRSGSDN